MRRWLLLAVPFPVLLAAGAGHGPAARGQKGEAVRRETAPPRLTLYLPIPLGVPGVADPATGVFVPGGYRAGEAVDLVVFLRGYDIRRPKAATSVREYWGSPGHPTLKSFQLREEVNRSGKNVILVVPPLGPFAQAGKLSDGDGAREFLARVLDGLWRDGPHAALPRRPAVRHLILAAHSGGGVPLRRLAQVLGEDAAFRERLKAVWGFDCLYGVKARDAEFWADWAGRHPGTQIRMFYLFTERAVGKDPRRPVSASNPVDHHEPTGTTGPATELARLAQARKLDNIHVVRETKATTLSHGEVPRAHLADLLKAARYLEDR